MKRSSLWIAVLGLSALSFVLPARADVVGPPPDDCPAGSEGATCHGGPYCSPVECATDGDCGNEQTCQDKPLCVSTILCAGLVPADADLTEYERPKVESHCPNGNECTQGATCKTQKVCIAATPASGAGAGSASTSGSSSSCGCRLAPSTPLEASLGALALGALGAVSVVRRRQRGGEASRASRQRRA